jgi:hypothetical protein
VDDDGPSLGEWAASLARRHWLLTATIAAHLIVLVFVPDVWQRQVEGQSRSGMAFTMSAASRDLWVAGTGLVIYVVAGLGVPHHWAMRPPSAGEITLARWLIRATGLAAMWVALAITL